MAKHKLTKTSSFTKGPKNRPFLRKTTSFAPKSRHSSSNPSNVSTWNVIVQTKLDDSLPCTLLQIDPNQDTPDSLLQSLGINKNIYVCELLHPLSGKPMKPRQFLSQSRTPLRRQLNGDGAWIRIRRREALRAPLIPTLHRFASFVKQ